ncbi:unnamed protein product [Dracunculus medinensis]|uniref:CARD domain-containing protein n=1 Tax=Dracunculus medinensis TaxID=318479 RepID=A0A0N4U9F6_DRAME|nr:unnamed protein product [Dracunculus medinensis]
MSPKGDFPKGIVVKLDEIEQLKSDISQLAQCVSNGIKEWEALINDPLNANRDADTEEYKLMAANPNGYLRLVRKRRISCLEGEAKELVEGFAMDGGSYRNVWEILESRYGDKSIIIEELYKELRELNPKTKDIKEIRKDLQRIFCQLTSLGENINNNSILSMAQAKLPIYVLKRVLKEKRKCSTRDMSELRNVMKACEEEELLLNKMLRSGDKEKLPKHKTINNFKEENSHTVIIELQGQQETCRSLLTFTVLIEQDLSQFWALETIGIAGPIDLIDDEEAYEFEKSVRRNDQGRYAISWPWKSPDPKIEFGRLTSIWNKLLKDASLRHQYDQIFKEQLDDKIIEPGPSKTP